MLEEARRLRIDGIVGVVVLLLRRLQEAVGCIFSCTALWQCIFLQDSSCRLRFAWYPPPPPTAPAPLKMALPLRTCYSKWLPCILIFAYFSVCCHCWQRCLLLVCCFARTAAATTAAGGGRGLVQCERYSRQFVVDAVIYIEYIYMHKYTQAANLSWRVQCTFEKTLVYSHTDLKYRYYW